MQHRYYIQLTHTILQNIIHHNSSGQTVNRKSQGQKCYNNNMTKCRSRLERIFLVVVVGIVVVYQPEQQQILGSLCYAATTAAEATSIADVATARGTGASGAQILVPENFAIPYDINGPTRIGESSGDDSAILQRYARSEVFTSNGNNIQSERGSQRLAKLQEQGRHARSTSGSASASSYVNISTNNKAIPQGICQLYNGATCEKFLRNQTVFVPPGLTMEDVEERLKAAYGVIKESKDMNANCRVYALPSLCYSTLPICRTPERTNHQYFAYLANRDRHSKKSKQYGGSVNDGGGNGGSTNNVGTSIGTSISERSKRYLDHKSEERHHRNNRQQSTSTLYDESLSLSSSPSSSSSSSSASASQSASSSLASTITITPHRRSNSPPTRDTENLRRICRDECELLENELCQKEYAIAKRHPTIGQKLPLEDCHDLPMDADCSSFGIAIDVSPDEDCYWEQGSGYRGTVAASASGRQCLKWSWLMKEIADYPELAGQNYCRNPGNTEVKPWCFVDDKTKEHCDIPKCAEQIWLYIIISFVLILGFIVSSIVFVCYRRTKKQGMTNIQNISLPNADKNIYGNSQMNSSFEMSRLFNQTNIPNGQQSSGRGSSLRVPQYTLQDVEFVEELGEGAFGKVYKGELTQKNGEKIFVAVKALKENASAKTQTDFKREIELISDLRHNNIVCILGVVLNKEPLCMLFEYMSHGDLHEYLIANSPNEAKSLTQRQFLYIAMQISDGMEYLSGHHYVHRDLAARNCLVGENLTVKISDFGLSRDIYSSDYYRVQSKSLLPVRWMPSESILYGKFTTESDVWSFGVVLWEIYSYGLQPYYGYSNQEVINMVRNRQLLPCPEACPTAVYSLMIECWHEQAVRRPSFSEISHRLKIWYQAQKKNQQINQSNSHQKHHHHHHHGSSSNMNSVSNSNSNLLAAQ